MSSRVGEFGSPNLTLDQYVLRHQTFIEYFGMLVNDVVDEDGEAEEHPKQHDQTVDEPMPVWTDIAAVRIACGHGLEDESQEE